MAEMPLSPLGVNMVVDLQTNAIIRDVLAESSIENSDSNASVEVGSVDLPLPLTPQLRLKFPDMDLTSSDSDEDLPVTPTITTPNNSTEPTRAASPPPNCAICLGRCKNKCFTDSCLHQFCFKCLCEWSKVKPECPLCKQIFKSIIHNVKPEGQFEEYHVPEPMPQDSRRIHRPIQVTAFEQLPYIVDGVVVRAGRHLIYPYPVTRSERSAAIDAQSQSEQHNELIDLLRQESPNSVVSISSLSQVWRRYVYERHLYAVPVPDVSGVFRECSAAFYRENPAQIHRLMPWLNRDVTCLLRHTEHSVTDILEEINNLLPLCNILSPTFRRRLRPYFGDRTGHFIHELHNFARSPYDMLGYDRIVQYSRAHSEGEVIEFSSSNDEADNIPGTSDGGTQRTSARRPRPAAETPQQDLSYQYRLPPRRTSSSASASSSRVNLLSFTISTTSEGTESPGVTVEVSSNRGAHISRGGGALPWPAATAINLTTHNRSGELIIDLDETDVDGMATISGSNRPRSTAPVTPQPEIRTVPAPIPEPMPAAPTYPQLTVADNIELSSASSDECEFVLERKPPHLRTPELVSLHSETDSDVMFVDESKPLRASSFSTSEDENDESKKEKNSNVKIQTRSQRTTVKHEIETQNNGGASTSTESRAMLRRRRGCEETSNGSASTSAELRAVAKRRRAYEEATNRAQTMQQSASSGSDEEYDPKRKVSSCSNARTQRHSRHSRKQEKASIKKTKPRKRRTSNEKRSGSNKRKSKKSRLYISETEGGSSSDDDDEGVNLMLLKQRIKIDKSGNHRSSPTIKCMTSTNNPKPNDDAPSTSAAAASKNTVNKVLPIKLVWGSKSKDEEITIQRRQSASPIPSASTRSSTQFDTDAEEQSSDEHCGKSRVTNSSPFTSASSSSTTDQQPNNNNISINNINESQSDNSSNSNSNSNLDINSYNSNTRSIDEYLRDIKDSGKLPHFMPAQTDSSNSDSGEDY